MDVIEQQINISEHIYISIKIQKYILSKFRSLANVNNWMVKKHVCPWGTKPKQIPLGALIAKILCYISF